MLRRLTLAAGLALVMAGSGHAQAPKPPIRAFDLKTTEALGQAMYRQDSAAWVATDALQAKVRDLGAAYLRGWIVEDRGDHQLVRFLRDTGAGLEAGYDIDVTPQFKATVLEPTERVLTAAELANYAAIQTANEAIRGQPICRAGYNHIVLKDPEREGWLVWLLAPMPARDAMPLGGHYRVSVTADGKTATQRDALSASCAVVGPPPKSPPGAQPAVAFVTHIVSPTPVETHVFLQIQSRHPLFVGAGDHVWSIERGHITDAGPIPTQPKR